MSPYSENAGVAVVITSHNYGKYLAEAVESVLRQTAPAAEIIIVDDDSRDNTKEIADRYIQCGVRYIRGEWHSPGFARNAGFLETAAPFLVFLDADDILHEDYLRCGIDVLRSHANVAIAYTDYQCFGKSNERYRRPEVFDWQRFDTVGDLSANSMLRRDALVQAGMWPAGEDIIHEDWILFRRIFRLGWDACKSAGLFYYRVHRESRFRSMLTHSYAERAGLFLEPMSLFVSLSGGEWQWHGMQRFLERQMFPHDRTHLFLLDYSEDAAFKTAVQSWAARSDYGMHAVLPAQSIEAAIRATNTPVLWFISDATALRSDAYIDLASRFEVDVPVVSMPCPREACRCSVAVRGEYIRRSMLPENASRAITGPFFHRHSSPSSSPAPTSERAMSIVAAADENYAMGLAAMGCSLIRNHTGALGIDFYIIDGGITDQTKSDILGSWEQKNVRVHWLTPDASRIQKLKLTYWFTQAVYLRLLIPDLLPQSVSKALYLDSDVIVLADIEQLWKIDLHGHFIGAIQDMNFPTFGQAFRTLEGMNVDPRTPYFHSGVLLMNLERWREEEISAKIVHFIEHHRDNVQWADQDGINAMLATSCLPLDPRWNVSVESFVTSWEQSVFDQETFEHLTTDPAIVHFATHSKPWHSQCEHPKIHLFFEYLDMTRWKGWRPHRPRDAYAMLSP